MRRISELSVDLREKLRQPLPEVTSTKIVTPATSITAMRPLLALKAASMLRRGDRPVMPVVAMMSLTDLEGLSARLIDRLWPEWERGRTKFGVAADKYVDAGALAIVAAAALVAPRVSLAGKATAGAILAQQGKKAVWAGRMGLEYQQATGGFLDLEPTDEGKRGVFEQLVGLTAAVATNDTDSWAARRILDGVALTAAGLGVFHSEQGRHASDAIIHGMIADATVVQPDLF